MLWKNKSFAIRVVTCDVIDSSCSRSVCSSSNHIWKECAGTGREGGLLKVRDFLRVKLDDLWLPVQKSSTSVRQHSGRYWHPARAAAGYEQNGGNLTRLRHKFPMQQGNKHYTPLNTRGCPKVIRLLSYQCIQWHIHIVTHNTSTIKIISVENAKSQLDLSTRSKPI